MDWINILKDLSFIINTSVEDTMIYYDKKVVNHNWLGFEKASDVEIVEKEISLGLTLPKSYKDFLKVSNGFRQISFFSGNLLPVTSIDWLKNTDKDLIDLLDESEDSLISDTEYFDYCENQRAELFRVKYLKNTIKISDWTDGSIVLLNPLVQYNDECEAWVYANWMAGATRYKSFADLIMCELNSTKKMINDEK